VSLFKKWFFWSFGIEMKLLRTEPIKGGLIWSLVSYELFVKNKFNVMLEKLTWQGSFEFSSAIKLFCGNSLQIQQIRLNYLLVTYPFLNCYFINNQIITNIVSWCLLSES
jgi:hypothetical protein